MVAAHATAAWGGHCRLSDRRGRRRNSGGGGLGGSYGDCSLPGTIGRLARVRARAAQRPAAAAVESCARTDAFTRRSAAGPLRRTHAQAEAQLLAAACARTAARSGARSGLLRRAHGHTGL
jgi:hypothetical protein